VDSFDNHAHIPEHFACVDAAAKENSHVALISAGWMHGVRCGYLDEKFLEPAVKRIYLYEFYRMFIY